VPTNSSPVGDAVALLASHREATSFSVVTERSPVSAVFLAIVASELGPGLARSTEPPKRRILSVEGPCRCGLKILQLPGAALINVVYH